MKKMACWTVLGLSFVLACFVSAGEAAEKKPEKQEAISWKRCLSQKDRWYSSGEAVRIGDNVLLYQRDCGGWLKNIDMARPLSEADKGKLRKAKEQPHATLDNGATHTQMRYLARVYHAARNERFRKAFIKALDYLLAAQYPSGGWPQSCPNPRGYARYITFNDGAMVGAMSILRDIANKEPPYAFVDEARRKKAEAAVEKGIECALKCQIVVGGKRTAWCQQHDDKTLKPQWARSFEPPAITAGESVGVVKFLMSIGEPGPRIINAVQSAVIWFNQVKLTGIRQVVRPAKPVKFRFHTSKTDKAIVKDPEAPPIWARFYEIGTNRPIFGDRDRKAHYTMAEISRERRTGYSWYGYYAAGLLSKDYPAWRKKHTPGRNVLEKKRESGSR